MICFVPSVTESKGRENRNDLRFSQAQLYKSIKTLVVKISEYHTPVVYGRVKSPFNIYSEKGSHCSIKVTFCMKPQQIFQICDLKDLVQHNAFGIAYKSQTKGNKGLIKASQQIGSQIICCGQFD